MKPRILERISDGETHLVFDYIDAGNAASTRDDGGVSLIQWCAYGAVFHGYPGLCQYLIEQGADVNKPMPDTGETPLHASLCKSDRGELDQVLRILLANGANPNCFTNPSVETDAFMRDVRTRAETPLHRAAAFGNEETIQMLLDAGARVDAKDMHGDSPLTWASWHLRPRAILRLLCYGPYRIR